MLKPAPFPEILTRVARASSTPTYVYFEYVIRRRVKRLAGALEGVPHRLLYAMKANAHPEVLKVIKESGVGIDAVSPAELLLALRLGFSLEQILFSANNMTDAEMHFAKRQGVLLNIGEMSRLKAFGESYPGSNVCIRLNPQIGAGHHRHVVTAGSETKFGIPVSRLREIQKVVKTAKLRVVGLHQHIGSGIPDLESLYDAAAVMRRVAGEFSDVGFVNLGGGLSVPYKSSDQPLDLSGFSARMGALVRSFHEDLGAEVWLEPGRFFVAEAGVLLVTATTIQDHGDRCFVGVDSGMGHLVRPALYDSYHEIVNLSNPEGPLRRYEVVGNICETGDRFASNREIPEIRIGDLLGILDAGAYGYSMASDYNLRPLPAEVLVPEANPTRFRVITERKSPAALVSEILARTPRGS